METALVPRMYTHNPILINHIAKGRIKKVKSMLNSKSAKGSDNYGTLLHYAVTLEKALIVKYMISIGCPIDFPGATGKTPLMLAVDKENSEIVRALLESGANIDIVDDFGKSALRMVFYSRYGNYKIIQEFFHRARTDAANNKKLIERLVKAGCTIHHAVRARDEEILKGLLQLGTEINLRNYNGQTILHLACLVGNLESVKLLIEYNANVNAIDFFEKSPLVCAARARNSAVIQFLLERDANPNPASIEPLYALFTSGRNSDVENIRECAEILLRHGSFPRNLRMFFNFFLKLNDGKLKNFNFLNYLVAHLAMMEMINFTMAESIMRCYNTEDNKNMSKLQKYYDDCEKMLKINVVETTSLLDLLTAKDHKMRVHLRNETFVSQFENFCLDHGMKEFFPYYYDRLIKKITEASRSVELEKKVISIICNLFDLDCNQFYIFVRQVVGYLNECDLKQLCEV